MPHQNFNVNYLHLSVVSCKFVITTSTCVRSYVCIAEITAITFSLLCNCVELLIKFQRLLLRLCIRIWAIKSAAYVLMSYISIGEFIDGKYWQIWHFTLTSIRISFSIILFLVRNIANIVKILNFQFVNISPINRWHYMQSTYGAHITSPGSPNS